MLKSFFFYSIILLTLIESCTINFKNPTNKNRDFPDLVLGDFKYISADINGRKEWELRASEAKMHNTKNEIYLYNMAMTFFNPNNSVKSFLSANSGYVNKENANVYAEGKVKILSENQAMLEANKVYWDNKKKIFYTDPEDLVTLRRGNTIITGYKMVADAELKEVVMERGKANIKK